ncbi:MAG: hypothetical protein LLG37_01455 [Spirochaetia bacterium]|nr:hypothetical protein [Spirochaetia bacterium]
MKKFALFVPVFLMLFSSCATLGIFEQTRPLHKRLVSGNETIREAAVIEFATLSPDAGKQVLIDTAEMLATAGDKEERDRVFETLKKLKAGAYVAVPVIKAAGSNPGVYAEAAGFIKRLDPSEFNLQELTALLKDENWEVCVGALGAISLMAGRAELSIPEIVQLMHRYGDDRARYLTCFDALLMINPEIGVLTIISDLCYPQPQVRKNALYKLFELQTYLSKSLPIKKEILPALIRALYSADEQISAPAQELMKELDNPQAKQAMQAYMGVGKAALNGLMRLAGSDPQTAFKKQEQSVEDRIMQFYKSIGRLDAVDEMKKSAPVK